MKFNTTKTLLTLGALAATVPALAQDACPNRGDLDPMYCDDNGDMVADAPTDPKKFKNPSTLVFTYTPVEDPAVYEKIFKPFTEHLAQCTAKRVVFYQVQSNAAEIEAMRSGRLHVGGLLHRAHGLCGEHRRRGALCHQGLREGLPGLQPDRHRKKDSPVQKLSDLKGRKVAHTSPSSNSGHMAPMALFPKEGLAPEHRLQDPFRASTTSRCWASTAATTTPPLWPPTSSNGWPHRGTIKEDDFRVHVPQRRLPDLVVCLRARPGTRCATRCCSASRLPLLTRDEEGASTAQHALLPDHLSEGLRGGARR
jgi:phosphonate transport system substrate-binding protein